MSPPDDDRDRRRYGDPLHGAAGIAVDRDQVRRDTDAGMPTWAAWKALEERVDAADDRATKALDAATAHDARWKRITSALAALVLASGGLLLYVVRKIDAGGYERRVGEEYRRQVDTNTEELRKQHDELIDLRGQVRGLFPLRAYPMNGPRDTQPDPKDATP